MLSLFPATQLFDEGKKYYREYDLPGTTLVLREQFFDKAESDSLYQSIHNSTPWKQHERWMYDKMVLDPRLTAWYGREGTNDWTEDLLVIKRRVEEASGIAFDCVLLNYYRNGQDSVAWHSDTKPKSGKHYPIASVSFGATRPFRVRHKLNKEIEPMEIPLTHGSFLLMGETMQDEYEHHIPKTSKLVAPRINCTFRIL